MDCSACCTEINLKEEEFLRCMIGDCNKCCHLLCAGKDKPMPASVKSWVCPECRCSSKRGGDNSLTPVGVSKRNRDTHAAKMRRVESEDVDERMQNLTTEVHDLRCEMFRMRKELTNSNAIISIYEAKLNESVSVIESYGKKLSQTVSIVAGYEAKISGCMCEMEKLLHLVKKCDYNSVSMSQNGQTSTLNSCFQTTVNSTESSAVNQIVSLQPDSLAAIVDQAAASTPASARHLRPQAVPVACATNSDTLKSRTQHQPTKVKSSHKRKCDSKNEPILPAVQFVSGSEKQLVLPNPEHTTQDSQQWVEVVKKRNYRQTSIFGTAGPSVTSLKAVKARKYLHLWNMASGVEEVREYLHQLCSDGSCTVEELVAKGDYKSYKLGIPSAFFDICFSDGVWPVNARIKPWINHRSFAKKPSDGALPANSPRPFRERPLYRASPTQ